MSRSPHLWLIPILLLAAFLRLWQLSNLPPGLYHDEAYYGLDALSLLQGKSFPQFYEGWELYAQDAHGDNPPAPTRFPVFFEGNYGREPLHVYLVALSIKLFGPTPFAIRLVSALAGTMAVLTTYLAAHALLPHPPNSKLETRNSKLAPPVLAAFFVAIIVPAIHFSRFGLRGMLFAPVSTLVIYFFWRGVNQTEAEKNKTGAAASFLFAGFFLGLGLYVYAAGRLLPLLFVLFIPLWLGRNWAAWRRYRVNISLMAGVSLLTALPLLLFYARYPYFFTFRLAYVANKGLGVVEGKPWLTWLLNVGRVIRGLFWQGETHLRHNLPGRPYLDGVQSGLLLIGLGTLGRFWQRPRHLFLILWLLVMLLPTLLSGDAPHFGRMVGATAPLAILVGLGLTHLGHWLYSLLTTHTSRLTAYRLQLTAYSLILISSLFFTSRDYFHRYATHPQLAADFYLPDWELGQYAAAQPANAILYFTPPQEEMATLYYALADPTRLRSYNGGQGLIPAGEVGHPAVYLLHVEAAAALQELQTFFPTGEVITVSPHFVAFHVPAAAPRLQVQHQTDAAFAGQITLRGWSLIQINETLLLTLVWQPQAPLADNYTAFVHLRDETGQVLSQDDHPPTGYPTADWRVGELVYDQFRLALPANGVGRDYKLYTGFYAWPSLQLLAEPVLLTHLTR
ncbi:MAG: hypothetical protein KJ063_04945 [Anaerolineae bacterium]|nr:hypothetical protein [Anaerolineae bacterium]